MTHDVALAALAQAMTEASEPRRPGIHAEAEAILAALPEGWRLTNESADAPTVEDLRRANDTADEALRYLNEAMAERDESADALVALHRAASSYADWMQAPSDAPIRRVLTDTAAAAEAARVEIVKAERERIKDAIRALPPLAVTNTEYVPQLKRRPDMSRDLAAILQAIDHLSLDPELRAALLRQPGGGES